MSLKQSRWVRETEKRKEKNLQRKIVFFMEVDSPSNH